MNATEALINMFGSFVLAGVAGTLFGAAEGWTTLGLCLAIDLIVFLAK